MGSSAISASFEGGRGSRRLEAGSAELVASAASANAPKHIMSSSTKARVGVSYSWGEELNGADKGAVDQFCAELRKCGIEVVRDKDEVKHGESLTQFMNQLAGMDHLCVFLSAGYLRSTNCMHELLTAWRRCSGAPEEFRARVHVWTLKSCPKIHDVEGRLEYVKYWKDQRKRLESLVKMFGTEGLGEADLAAYRRVKDFQNSVSDILAFVADTLRPTSLPEFVGWIRKVFPSVEPTPKRSKKAASVPRERAKEARKPSSPPPPPWTGSLRSLLPWPLFLERPFVMFSRRVGNPHGCGDFRPARDPGMRRQSRSLPNGRGGVPVWKSTR